MNEKDTFLKLIEEICNEEKIKVSFLSKDWIIMLEKNNKTKFIAGYKFDLNSHGLGEVLDDKYALYEVLRKKNIPIIEHNILFSSTNSYSYALNCNKYDSVYSFFEEHNQEIVIKANLGACGNDVFKVTNKNQIANILNQLFQKNHSISYCPFYNIKNEYRVIILNNKVKLIYKKYKPIVIGNGKDTIKELLISFNKEYFENRLNDQKYDKVLKNNEVYEYDWKFNLSQGAKASLLKDKELESKITTLATMVSKEIGVNFVSVDIIETTNKELLIMEINSGIMMKNIEHFIPNGREVVKSIYKEAINELFN